MRSSSGRKPMSPPTIALSVPWPSPVRANDPCSSMRARSGVPPTRHRASSPSRQAPAVWLDDGPTMTGPMMSSRETIGRYPAFRLSARRSSGCRYWPVYDVLTSATCSGVPAATAAFRAEIDDPVRRLDHVQIVLDHQHGVAAIDQPMEHFQQQPDVLEMQPGRRLVEDVERPAGIALRKLGRELDPLRLAARK